MVKQEKFPEPDPYNYFFGDLRNYRQKLLSYTILVGTCFSLQFLLLILVLTSSSLRIDNLLEIAVHFFLLFLVFGSLIIFYYIISGTFKLYQFTKSKLDFKPTQEEDDIRLQIRGGSLKEEHGVQLSNARSLVIGIGGAFSASFWPSIVDLLLAIAESNTLMNLFEVIQKANSEKAAETFVTIAGIATRTDIHQLITILNLSDYYLLVKFGPAIVIGYVSFLHIVFLLHKTVEKEDDERAIENELRGLIEYLRYSYSALQNRSIGTELWNLFKLVILGTALTFWHLGLVWTLFF